MQEKEVNEKIEEKIRKRVQHEFPSSKILQDIHYYRYLKEIEWTTMSPEEIVKDIKEGASEIKKEINRSISSG